MPTRLTVMSYNVRYDNPSDGTHVWRNRRDRVASVVRFHDPDIVGLQEALHDQLDDLRDRLPGYEWLAAGRTDVESAGEYAAVGYDRARFNLEADGTVWLSETPDEPGSVGWDAAFPRLLRWVRLRDRDTGVEFHHFNTHFDHAGERARVESARLLLDTIDDVTDDTPIVVTGDFNSRPESETYRVLIGRSKTDTGRVLRDAHHTARTPHHGPITTMTDFRNLVPDKKIDYVFVSADVEVELHGAIADAFGDGEYPSDHLPVLAAVSLPEWDGPEAP